MPTESEATERDLVSEVEEQIELLNKVNWSYYESIRGVVVPVPELLRRLVEEVKRQDEALKKIRDSTSDMWACALAERVLEGDAVEAALLCAEKYNHA